MKEDKLSLETPERYKSLVSYWVNTEIRIASQVDGARERGRWNSLSLAVLQESQAMVYAALRDFTDQIIDDLLD